MKKIALLSLALLAGCNTIQNQYVDATGTHGSGTTTFGATQEDVRFSIADKGDTCTGTAANWRSATLVMPVSCKSGKTGTVTMTRPMTNASQVTGEGTMTLTNGEMRRFVFAPK
jgi:hypothetical protein